MANFLNKKFDAKILIAVAVIALLIGGYYAYSAFKGDKAGSDFGNNGIWDPVTQKCMPPEGSDQTFFQCCFDINKKQIDCYTGQPLAAIYGGTRGIYWVAHGVQVINTGNIGFDGYISSATWTPIHAELTAKWAPITGIIYKKWIGIGLAESWATGLIDLQLIGGAPGSPISYGLSLVTIATDPAGNLPDSQQTTPASVTVEREEIGYSVSVNLGS